MLFSTILKHVVTIGQMTVIASDGSSQKFGGSKPGPQVTIKLHDSSADWWIGMRSRLRLGEAYMEGRLTIEGGTIYDLLDMTALNIAELPRSDTFRMLTEGLGRVTRSLRQYNPVPRARRNVAHHYDLDGRLYKLFLDDDLQYSCAYFTAPGQSLEAAQANKRRHLAAKLLLQPGQKVLDIGSGWGGLALDLASMADVEVTGLTLSTEQHAVATARAEAAGLSDRVRFVLRDYRQETGTYDRIVSVGMFEHVGIHHYETYMDKVRDLLTEDGVALIHTIGRADGPASTNPWIARYIFPGGYSPALSEMLPVIERSGLWVTDVEILRQHYAETIRAWSERFQVNRNEVRSLYDERFCRMWEFYLAGAEIAFRRQAHVNFQIQASKQLDTVPITRDYITDWERAMAARQDQDVPRDAPRAAAE